VLANGGSPSDIGAAPSTSSKIVFNGGTLQYIGPGVSIDRQFTLAGGGGTIDNESAGPLAFTSTGSLGMTGNGPRTLPLPGPGPLGLTGNGPRTLTLTGPGPGGGDTLACNITNHPAGTSLAKTGAGLWILTGTNTYGGGTALLAGSLQVGTGSTNGTIGGGNI